MNDLRSLETLADKSILIPRTYQESDLQVLSQHEPGFVANLTEFTFGEFYLSRKLRVNARTALGRAMQRASTYVKKPVHYLAYWTSRILNSE